MPLSRALIIVVLILATTGKGYATPAKGNLAISAYITGVGYCIVTDTQNIAFGALNPLNPVDVKASGSITAGCIGLGSGFTVGVTQVTASPLTLKSGSNTIPYSLELPTSATSSNDAWISLVSLNIPIKADIRGIDYKQAPAGNYSDTVILQITP